MKRFFNLLIICFLAFFASNCGGSSSADKERIARLEAQIDELKNANSTNETSRTETTIESTTSDNVSTSASAPSTMTYALDVDGNHFVFTINMDEESCIMEVNGQNFYGKASKLSSNYKNKIKLSGFTGAEKYTITVNGKKITWNFPYEPYIDYKTNYLYTNYDTAETNNPDYRLSLKRIN